MKTLKDKVIPAAFVAYGANRYFDNNPDAKIEAIAKKHGGVWSGSGMGFGQRDIDFEFKSVKKRNAFVIELRRLRKGLGIQSVCRTQYNDEELA